VGNPHKIYTKDSLTVINFKKMNARQKAIWEAKIAMPPPVAKTNNAKMAMLTNRTLPLPVPSPDKCPT
jgi:hypothetical protein